MFGGEGKKSPKRKEKLAARECLMAAVSPLENSQVECELFRMCGKCAEHEATPPSRPPSVEQSDRED